MGVTTPTPSSNHLNDTQYLDINPLGPGTEKIRPLEGHLISPLTKKSLSVTTLPEREETPCYLSLPERQKTPCLSLPEREKTLRVQTPPEGEKTLRVQSVSIQEKQPPVGGRLSQFVSQWERRNAHRSIIRIISEGYRLPFRERPALTRSPFVNSGYVDQNRQNALSNAIQDLLSKKAIEIVHTQNSLGFYSRLFLVPKPGNRWRPVIDLSALNKFLAVPKFKMETPESIRASQKGRMDYINRLNGCIPTHTYPSSISQVPQIPLKRNNLSVQKSTIRPSNGSFSVYKCSERSKTHGPTTTHSHPPVSGRLVNKSTYQREMPLTNPSSSYIWYRTWDY